MILSGEAVELRKAELDGVQYWTGWEVVFATEWVSILVRNQLGNVSHKLILLLFFPSFMGSKLHKFNLLLHYSESEGVLWRKYV